MRTTMRKQNLKSLKLRKVLISIEDETDPRNEVALDFDQKDMSDEQFKQTVVDYISKNLKIEVL